MHVLGVDKLVEMLTTDEGRAELRKVIVGDRDSFDRFKYTMIGNSVSRPDYAARMLNDIAREEGRDPFDIQCDLLRDDRLSTGAIFHTMCEEDVERVMQWPRAMVGTDGSYAPGDVGNHPRGFATFTRILGRYVRERKVITLENAIRKMCYLPAMVYGMSTKGLIREGMDADLVLVDFSAPHLMPCHNVTNALVFSAKGGDVAMTMVKGKILYQNGQFPTIDLKEVVEELTTYALPRLFDEK